ncbi:MAG: hypothetical protein AB1512_18900 [Thermodesulfobacteriota bacterium]
MYETAVAWMKGNIGRPLFPKRKRALPFRIKSVDQHSEIVRFVFLDKDTYSERNALPLPLVMFRTVLAYLEANKERMVRLGAQ